MNNKMLPESSDIDNRPLYNSRIISTYIKLVRRNYDYISIDELLRYAEIEPYQVEDEGHWFTQRQVDLLYERLEKLTGNKNIAREAGRFGASHEAIGVMRPYILGLIGPAQAYAVVGKYASNFTKSSVYKSKKMASNKIEITVATNEGVNEKLFQCDNRIGYFEAIAIAFNYKLPRIEHPQCIFKGDSTCRYIISWREFRSAFWDKIRDYAALFLSAICLVLFLIYPDIALRRILPVSIFIVLILTLYAGRIKEKELKSAIDNLRDSSDELLGNIDVNYNNALMINEIGLAISKQMDIDSVLTNSVQVLEKRLDYDRGIILIANKDKTKLLYRVGFGYTDEMLGILKNTSFDLNKPESTGVFVVSFHKQKPFLINDIDEIKESLSEHSMDVARKIGAKSFICCPIIHEDESIGILAVDNIKTKRPLRQSDINLLMGVAPAIGVSINNALLIEAKEHQFKSLLQTLAASIDARDFLTAGHSEKVAEYAVGICEEMGMSGDYCKMIRVAALLHDYGKIGIVDSILKKEGDLAEQEYEEIKSHAEKTRIILEKISFEGIYKEVPEIAGNHHEKIDGSGYPQGRKDEEIPLGARIIAVADFFEAITAKRHYRDQMPPEKAFEMLEAGKDTHFDRVIVDAFTAYYNRAHNNDNL